MGRVIRESGYAEKEQFEQSPTATKRFRRPQPNPNIAEVNTQFIFDHSRLAAVIPDRRAKALIEATTQRDNTSPHQAINHNGRSAVFGALGRSETGGQDDEPGLAGRLPPMGPKRSGKGKISDPLGNNLKR